MKAPELTAIVIALLAGIVSNVPARADTPGLVDGRQIYTRICQGCHMSQGEGAEGAGHYPALARNPALASRQYMALTVLKGRRNMPAFSAKRAVGFFFGPVTLTDAEVAAVVNYVRMNFGNHYRDLTTAEEVKALDP